MIAMCDRFDSFSLKPGIVQFGIGVMHGKCGDCDGYHFDITIYLGWVAIVVYLGEPL